MSVNSQIADLIAKMKEFDEDDRYMAISDLLAILKGRAQIEVGHLQTDIFAALLERMDKDVSNDVCTISVTCLSQLLKICERSLITVACDALSTRILRSSHEIKDIYGISLKTIIDSVPEASGPTICNSLTEFIITGISQTNQAIKIEFMEILPKLLARFGVFLSQHLATIMAITLDQLDLHQVNVNKRASRILFQLAPFLQTGTLNQLLENLLDKVDECAASELHESDGSDDSSSDDSDLDSIEEDVTIPTLSAYVQSINAVAESVSLRLQSCAQRLVSTMLRSMGNKRSKHMGSKSWIELREQCLATVTTCISAGHTLEPSLIASVIKCALEFLNYDPNFIEDSDSDDSDSDDTSSSSSSDDDEDDQYDVEYEDTDDTSWKVRQSCLELLKALTGSVDYTSDLVMKANGEASTEKTNDTDTISKQSPGTNTMESSKSVQKAFHKASYLDKESYALCFNGIVARFNERESTVQALVFDSIAAYLRYATLRKGNVDGAGYCAIAMIALPQVIKSATHFLSANCTATRSKKSKTAGMKSVGILLGLLGDVLFLTAEKPSFTLEDVQQPISFALSQADVILKLKAFKLLQQIMSTSRTAVSEKALDFLIPLVLKSAADRWYRVANSALTVVLAFIRRVSDGRSQVVEYARTRVAAIVEKFSLYQCLEPLAFGLKKDQVVKDLALRCLSTLIAHAGDILGRDIVAKVMSEAAKRLKSEVQRVSVLQALQTIMQSEHDLQVDPELMIVLQESFELLRQSDRKVKVLALQLMKSICNLMNRKVRVLDADLGAAWENMDDIISIIRSNDVYLSRLAYQFIDSFSAVAQLASESARKVINGVLDQLCHSVFQGHSVRSGSPFLQYRLDFIHTICRKDASLREMAVTKILNIGFLGTREPHPSSQSQSVSGVKDNITSINERTAQTAAAASCLAAAVRSVNDEKARFALLHTLALLEDPFDSTCQDPSVQTIVKFASTHRSANFFFLQSLGQLCQLEPAMIAANEEFLLRMQDSMKSRTSEQTAATTFGNLARVSETALKVFWSFCIKDPLQSIQVLTADANIPAVILFTLDAICELLRAEIAAQTRVVSSEYCCKIEHVIISPLLSKGAASFSEGLGRRLGECLGVLLLLEPTHMMPVLQKQLNGDNSIDIVGQQQILLALNAFIVDASASQISQYLDSTCEMLLMVLRQTKAHPKVAQAAVQALNALVHHHPGYVNESRCRNVWISILKHMSIRADLKRVVDLGPFKQKIDDGLPIRKAAYTCASTLLQQLPVHVNMSCGGPPGEGVLAQLVGAIVAGLKETEYDARILSQQILLKLCAIDQQETAKRADDLLAPFAAKLGKTKITVDSTATSNQQERNLVTSSVRVLFTLQKRHQQSPHPLVERPAFKQLINLIQSKPALRSIWAEAAH